MWNKPVHNKFVIIKDGDKLMMVIARCTYHAEITGTLNHVTKCISGGWWDWDRKNKTIRFFGDSDQFGWYKFSDLEECIKSGEVYTNSYKTRKFDLSEMVSITATDHEKQIQNKIIEL